MDLEPKELIPPEEMGVMTVEHGGLVHLSTSKIVIGGEHIIRPPTEVTCKHCRETLERVGIL